MFVFLALLLHYLYNYWQGININKRYICRNSFTSKINAEFAKSTLRSEISGRQEDSIIKERKQSIDQFLIVIVFSRKTNLLECYSVFGLLLTRFSLLNKISSSSLRKEQVPSDVDADNSYGMNVMVFSFWPFLSQPDELFHLKRPLSFSLSLSHEGKWKCGKNQELFFTSHNLWR